MKPKLLSLIRVTLAAAVLRFGLGLATQAQAQNGTWISAGGGNWSTTANWLNGIVATGSGNTANFDTLSLSSSPTVTLNAPYTLTTLLLGDVAFAYDWTLSGANTLTLAGTTPGFDIANQGTTVSTVVAGTAGLTKMGSGSLTLGGATDTYTGGTTINGGSLTLNFNSAGSPTSTLIPSQVLALGGGTLNLNGKSGSATSQAIGNVTLNNGYNVMTLTPNGGGTVTATLGTLGQNGGSVVVFNGPATIGANNVAVAATGTITTTTAGRPTTEYGILNAGGAANKSWGTVGLYDWASTFLPGAGGAGSSPYTIIGGSQVTGFYTVAVNNGANTGNNIDIATQQTPGATATEVTSLPNTDSLRYNSAIAPYVHGGNNVQTGGILVTPNMGTINACIDYIRLTRETTLIQNNTAAVFIIGSFATSASAFDKSGAGTLFINPISGNNLAMNYTNGSTYTLVNNTGYNYTPMTATGSAPNPPYLNGGVTVINSTLAFSCPATQGTTPGGAGTVNLNGGTLLSDLNNVTLNNPSAVNAPRNVYLGGNGGGLASQVGYTMTVPGLITNAVAGAGPLTIGIPPSAANGNAAGLVPGTGGTTANPALFGSGTVALTASNTYTGGTLVYDAILNFTNGALGTGGVSLFNGGTLQWGTSTPYDISSKTVTMDANGATLDVNANNVTLANPVFSGNSGTLTVFSSVTSTNAIMNLKTANTYTGGTIITNAILNANNLTGSATGPGNVTINNGGTLGGMGIVSGSVTVNTGGQTLPGSSGATNTIGGNLTYNSGASATFTLGPSAIGGGNDQIILNGASSVLTCGGVSVGINCGPVLDQASGHDYVLLKLTGASASISGSFNAMPVWVGTVPANSGNYVVVVSTTNVVLHDTSPVIPPVISAVGASPNPVLDYQTFTVSATASPGSGTIDPNVGVTVDLTPLQGALADLIYDGAGHYTNSFMVGGSVIPGIYLLNVVAQNSLGGAMSGNLFLTVGNLVVWNGADAVNNSNWSDGLNWLAGLPPGAGVDLQFAGVAGLAPVMDSSYAIASVTFTNGAGAFSLDSSGGSILTLTAGVTNDSANVQTLNLPVILGGSVTLNAASNSLVVAGVVAGGGALSAVGAGSTTLSGANTYTGNTTVNAGATLALGDPGDLGDQGGGTGIYAGTVFNGGTFVFNSSSLQTLAGVVSGAGLLNVAGSGQLGSGQLTLTGANTYTGPTAIGTNGTLVVSGAGTLYGGNYAGNITNNGTLIYQSSIAQTLGGIISGAGTNELASAVTLSLNGSNTYAGGTFVNEGTLNLGTATCCGTGPVILGNTGYSGAIYLDTGSSFTFTNPLFVNPGGIRGFYTAGSPTPTWAGLITLVNGATFEFGPNGNSTTTISGGTAGNGTLDITFPQAARTATIVVTGGAINHVGTLENTLGGAGGIAQINAVIGPNITEVLQNSFGPMNLTATNTYTCDTTINLGTVTIGGAGQLGGGSYAGNIDFNNPTNANFVYNSSAAQTISGNINGTGNVTNSGPGILTLAGPNSYTGVAVITGGQLWGNADGNSTLANNAVTISPTSGVATLGVSTITAGEQFTCASLTVTAGANLGFVFTTAPSTSVAPLNVAGTLTFNATPTVTIDPGNLTANTTYPLLVCGGTAPVAVPTLINIRGFSGSTLAWSGNTLNLTVGSVSAITEPLNWATSGTNTWNVNDAANSIWKDSEATPVLTYYAEPVSGSADSIMFGDTFITANPTVTLNATVSPTSTTFSNSTYSYTVSGSGSIAGTGTLTKNGTNLVTLTTANSYSGGTTISAGTLQLGNGASGKDGIINSPNVTNNSALVYDYFGTNTYGGVISGTGTVTKSGAGTQILSGTNAYSGNTIISAGRLALGVAGSIAGSGNISVGSGALFDVSAVSGYTLGAAQTLSGSGTVLGAVEVNGTLAPTNSAAGTSTLAFSNNLTLAGTALFTLNNTNAQTAGKVVSLGTIAFGGVLTVVNGGGTLVAGNTFQLFSGARSGAFAVTNLPVLGSGLGWSNSLAANGSLTVVATTVIPTQKAGITGLSLVNGNVVLNATNGQTGGTYYLLSSTNLAVPLSQWQPVATNVVNTNGNNGAFTFTGTNAVTPGLPQQFYMLSNTNN